MIPGHDGPLAAAALRIFAERHDLPVRRCAACCDQIAQRGAGGLCVTCWVDTHCAICGREEREAEGLYQLREGSADGVCSRCLSAHVSP